ncbi:hypothetical protein PZA11_004120 [Diplocarpon coronariae]
MKCCEHCPLLELRGSRTTRLNGKFARCDWPSRCRERCDEMMSKLKGLFISDHAISQFQSWNCLSPGW